MLVSTKLEEEVGAGNDTLFHHAPNCGSDFAHPRNNGDKDLVHS